jgi:hypothetical protein
MCASSDLQTALAPPEENAFGTKIYENVGLSDFTPAPVTRVSELLGLRSYFMSQLGPRYLWIDDRPFIVLTETKLSSSL